MRRRSGFLFNIRGYAGRLVNEFTVRRAIISKFTPLLTSRVARRKKLPARLLTYKVASKIANQDPTKTNERTNERTSARAGINEMLLNRLINVIVRFINSLLYRSTARERERERELNHGHRTIDNQFCRLSRTEMAIVPERDRRIFRNRRLVTQLTQLTTRRDLRLVLITKILHEGGRCLSEN